MARKKKAVAKRGIAGLPATVQQRIEGYVEKFANRERQGSGKTLSIRGKKFRFDGRDLGSEIDVIMLDYIFIKQYYEQEYDPDNLTPPDCFAIADEETELKPLEDSPEIQGDEETGMCDGCWANEFESAARGKGKACQDKRRIALISADHFDEPNFVDTVTAESVGFLTMGGTSLVNWKAHTKRLGKTLKVAPFQVITTLSFDDSVDFEKLEFHVKEQIEDPDILTALVNTVEETAEDLRNTPDFSGAEEAEEKPQAKRKKKAPAKKKPARKKAASKKSKSRSRSKYS